MSRIEDLHHLARALFAGDNYGQTPRIEPTMGTPAMATPAAAPPPPDPRGAVAGPQAVESQLFGEQGAATSESGRNAAYPDRASMQGESAVEQALAPSPYAEGGRNAAYPDVASTQGEAAVDRALNPPTGSGSGFWSPGEGADTARAVGQSAVEGALAKRARGKIARGSGGTPKPMFAPARTADPNLPHSQSRSRSPGKREEDDTPTE